MDHSTTYGMCLLHADYHPMDGDCWSTCLDYNLAHQDIPEAARRDMYQAEVERAMLDTLIHTARPAPCATP